MLYDLWIIKFPKSEETAHPLAGTEHLNIVIKKNPDSSSFILKQQTKPSLPGQPLPTIPKLKITNNQVTGTLTARQQTGAGSSGFSLENFAQIGEKNVKLNTKPNSSFDIKPIRFEETEEESVKHQVLIK